MCGITGYLNIHGSVNRPALKKMTDIIRHRGPDDEGFALISRTHICCATGNESIPNLGLLSLFDVPDEDFFLGFGHRRLAILDPTPAGHQPMVSNDNKVCIVYNGELYNYIEVRKELQEKGYSFRTDCDTEVLIYSYYEWGTDCVKHFNGMWGFALWDTRKKVLFCSRDRLGAKPFLYYHDENRFIFGSELKQLCCIDDIERKIDLPALASNMIYHISDYNERTMIESVKFLPAGCNLLITLSEDCRTIESFEIKRYWDLQCITNYNYSVEEWKLRIKEEFARSCAWRLRSDVPVGVLLSGGLDSSCLVAEICSQYENPSLLQTFTTSYPDDKNVEEWQFADMVNTHCGCKGLRVLPEPDKSNIEEKFENLVWHIEMPSGISLLGVKDVLHTAAGKGYKVILNGQCGDESWLGYERYYSFYFSYLLRKGKLLKALKEFQLASNNSRLAIKDLVSYYAYFNFPKLRENHLINAAKEYCCKNLLSKIKKKEFFSMLFSKSINDLQYKELTAVQLPHIVHFDDRLFMSESIESRIPFMDYKLVELAVTVPCEYKINNGYTKSIMREIYNDYLPKEVVWRTNKMGFGAPTNKWKQSFKKEYVYDMFENAKTKELFNINNLKTKYEKNNTSEDVFRFLQTEIFARKFNVQI